MDTYKAKMTEECGVGGIHCDCCNPYHSKNNGNGKKKLNRLARHRLKQEDTKSFLDTAEKSDTL